MCSRSAFKFGLHLFSGSYELFQHNTDKNVELLACWVDPVLLGEWAVDKITLLRVIPTKEFRRKDKEGIGSKAEKILS